MAEVGVEMRCNSSSAMAFISLLLFIISIHSCNAQVPLLMWTSDGYSLAHQTQATAGQTVSGGQLVSYLKSSLSIAPHNVVLFLQDQLSIDDFTAYGGVFGNKQTSAFLNIEAALQASFNPLVLPVLRWSASDSVLEFFQRELQVPAVHMNPSDLKQLQPNGSRSSLLAVHLPYTAGVQSKELLLRNGSGYLSSGRTFQQAIVTPDSPPQTSVKHPLVFSSSAGKPCILLWAETLSVSYSHGQWVDLGPATFDRSAGLTGSFCNETLSRLVLNYRNVLNFQSLRVIFWLRSSFFPVSSRQWSVLERVLLEYDGQTAIFNGSGAIYSPAEYSFHCQSVSSTDSPLLLPTDSATQWRLSFTDFQIQGFGVSGLDFSHASDCAGFFTPGIWMGLLTSLLMLLILSYGLHMIMQVHTVDRFDDPKGPVISVPLNE